MVSSPYHCMSILLNKRVLLTGAQPDSAPAAVLPSLVLLTLPFHRPLGRLRNQPCIPSYQLVNLSSLISTSGQCSDVSETLLGPTPTLTTGECQCPLPLSLVYEFYFIFSPLKSNVCKSDSFISVFSQTFVYFFKFSIINFELIACHRGSYT